MGKHQRSHWLRAKHEGTREKKGLLRGQWGVHLWIACLAVLFALPRVGAAQEFVQHGEVVQVRGETIEVRVTSIYGVPEAATGTVFTQNTVGEIEQEVPVAELDVETVDGSVVTGRITEQLGEVSPEEGFSVAFSPVRTKEATMGSPTRGLLQLKTVPERAEVTARVLRSTATGRTIHREPRALGRTPLSDSLLPGRYRLTFRKEGYTDTQRNVLLRPDTTISESVELDRRQGTLAVRAQPDSAVIAVDGQRAGRGRIEQSVDAGEHRIRVTAAGHRPVAETLSVAEGGERTLDVALDRRRGSLAITSMPKEARVQIDGTDVGRTPLTVERSPGTYEVRVAASQYEPYTEEVAVEAGAETTVATSLRRPLQVQLAASHGPGVQNARLERDGDWIVVQYDLRGDADEYDVMLRLSDERGQSFSTEPETVRGDVGEEVAAGSEQEIRWAALEDYPRGLIGENFRLRVATDPAGGNGVLYALGSMLVGGGVTAAVLTLQDEGDGEGGEIPTPPSPPD